MHVFLYCLFLVFTLRITWGKRRSMFWAIMGCIFLTPFIAFIWAICMDDHSDRIFTAS